MYMYMVFQLTSWSLNWMTFDIGWHLMVKLGTMELILSNILINFTFGKFFTWTGTNNDNIWLPIGYTSDFEHCSLTWQNFSFGKLLTELAHIMTTYDFIWTKPGHFEQYLNRLQLDTFSLLVNFSHELAHIMTTYDFLSAKQAILSNVWTDFNLTQFTFWTTFDMNWLI